LKRIEEKAAAFSGKKGRCISIHPEENRLTRRGEWRKGLFRGGKGTPQAEVVGGIAPANLEKNRGKRGVGG